MAAPVIGGFLSQLMGGMIGNQAAGAMGSMADAQIAQGQRQQQIGQRDMVGAMANKGQPSTPPQMMQAGMAAAGQMMSPQQLMQAARGLQQQPQGWRPPPGPNPYPYQPSQSSWHPDQQFMTRLQSARRRSPSAESLGYIGPRPYGGSGKRLSELFKTLYKGGIAK